MNVLAYVKSLLPSFGQDRVVDDLSRMRADVEDSLIPSLDQAAKAFKGQKFKSTVALGVEKALQRQFNVSGNVFEILLKLFHSIPSKLDVLDEAVESHFSKDIVKEAFTYRRANILKYAEMLSFVIGYTSRLTLRIIAAEKAAIDGTPVDAHLTAAQTTQFTEKYTSWLDALKVIDKSAAELKSAIESVPDVIIDETNAHGVEATVGAKTLDPMGMNFISPSWNLIYRVRMYAAEWDVATINRSKEERKLVELRLRELKEAREGKPSALIEHQIETAEDRLKKIDFRIARLSGDLH